MWNVLILTEWQGSFNKLQFIALINVCSDTCLQKSGLLGYSDRSVWKSAPELALAPASLPLEEMPSGSSCTMRRNIRGELEELV